MKQSISLFLLFLAPLYAQTEMTAEDAIRQGLKNNFDIQIARNNAQISENNAGKGTAGFLPSLDVTGSYQLATSDDETNHPFIPGGKSDSQIGNARINFKWTVFDGFSMFANKGQFQALAKLGQAQAKSVIENTVTAILAAYFNLVQQEQLLDVAGVSRDISKTRYQKEKVRNELGGGSSTDLLNARVSYNSDQASWLNQELATLAARNNLNILLARDPAASVTVRKEIVIPDLQSDFSKLWQLAKERNSSLRAARYSLNAAQKGILLSRSSFFPLISLGASYGYNDRTVSTDTENPIFPDQITNQTTDGNISLQLSWNLFNGFRNKIDWQNAKIEAKNQSLALENARNQLSGLLREKFETFHKQLALVELEKQNVAAAQQNLSLQEERYQLGATTSLEFRDAQVNLIRAQTAFIVARYQTRITRLEIERLTGRLVVE